jgi:hypothetical protein
LGPIAAVTPIAAELHGHFATGAEVANRCWRSTGTDASSLEKLDELYSVGNGAAAREMIAQFGCDRRCSIVNVDKIELGLRSAR